MTLVDHRVGFEQDSRPATTDATLRRGFRPASRRRSRIAVGVLLAAIAIGGNVLVYAGLDDKVEVLQVVRDVPAGDVIGADDLRVVEVDVDPTVPVLAPDAIGTVVNQYARVHIASGSLIVPVLVQSAPLVALGQGVVAVEVRPTQVPSGLRERSRVALVVPSGEGDDFVTEGRIVARDGGSGDERVSLSVEVTEHDAAAVAAADDVRIVLLDPADDPVYEAGA
jgi:hypothetical protein